MKKNKSKLNIIIFVLSLILFLKPAVINKLTTINSLYNIFIILIANVYIFIYISYLMHVNKKNKIFFLLTLYFLCLFISTVLNKEGIMYYLKIYMQYIGVFCFISYFLAKDYNKYISVLSKFLFLLIFINFISVFFVKGENRDYFLGYDNNLVPIITISFFIILYSSYLDNDKINVLSIITLILISITSIMIKSSNAKVAMVLSIMYFIIITINNQKLKKIFEPQNVLIFSIILFLIVVIFKKEIWFEYLIKEILNRDLTLSGRTRIWDRTITLVKQNIIIGTGVIDPDLRTIKYHIFHAHSTILNILLEGGILALCFCTMLILEIIKILKKYKSKKEYILGCAFSVFFIITVIEFYTKNLYLYILIAIIAQKYINDKGENKI